MNAGRRPLAFLGFFFALVFPVWAHDPGLSSANLSRTRDGFELVLTFNQQEVAQLLEVKPENLDGRLEPLARRGATLEVGGEIVAPDKVEARVDDNRNVEFRYRYPDPAGLNDVRFTSRLLPELAFGHRQAFAAHGERGEEIVRSILSARDSGVAVIFDAPAPATSSRFLDFFLLGVRHIVTGYDHLLFLFGLLLVCRTPRAALLLVTCFTVAHSLTLALATFGLVELPSRWVEAAIAASIVYVGVENLFRHEALLRGRGLLTFAFGLVHGLGFASVLREMGIAQTGWNAAVPLVAFNAGVETGQLAIAADLAASSLAAARAPGVPAGGRARRFPGGRAGWGLLAPPAHPFFLGKKNAARPRLRTDGVMPNE